MSARVLTVCDMHEGETVIANHRFSYRTDEEPKVVVDLCEDHLQQVMAVVERYTTAVPGMKPGMITGSRRHQIAQRKIIRDWAREHGYYISTRGYLSGDVIYAYQHAHTKSPTRE